MIVRISYLCCFLIIGISTTFSQNSMSIGPDVGFSSNFSKSSKAGIGGSAEYANKFSKNIGARIYVGYHYFKGKFFDSHVSFLPARAGLQAYLADLLFVYGEAGIVGYDDSNNTNESGFSYALGAGYKIPPGLGKQFMQISAYYNFFRFNRDVTYTWFNIRIAYGLDFGRKYSGEK